MFQTKGYQNTHLGSGICSEKSCFSVNVENYG